MVVLTTYLNLPAVKNKIMPVKSLGTKGLTSKCMYERLVKSPIN